MSASSFTDWHVRCDQGGCTVGHWASELDSVRTNAASARRILKRRGWLVSVPNPSPEGWPRRMDFCPAHKGLELARRGKRAIERAEAEMAATQAGEG